MAEGNDLAVISDEELRRERVRLLLKDIEAGDKIRFAVGSDETSYSGTWIAWSYHSDFYVAAKSIAGSLKISLHPPKGTLPHHVGRVADTQEFVNNQHHIGTNAQSRAYTEWRLPPPPDEGAHASVVVTFPTNHLHQSEPKGKPKKPLLLFSPAPRDYAVEVWFFRSREPAASLEAKLSQFGFPVLQADLTCGASIFMVVRQQLFDSRFLPTEEMMKQNKVRWVAKDPQPLPGTPFEGLTGLFWDTPDDGKALRIVEVGGIKMTVGP